MIWSARDALEIGKAAEHLVCADLILGGYRAFLTDQGLPYDLVVDIDGKLTRIQVKSTLAPRKVPNRPGSAPSYMFHCRRAGKAGLRKIGNNEFEILALVALDIRCVAYLAITNSVLQTIHLRGPSSGISHKNKTRGNIDQYPFAKALEDAGLV